MLRHFFKIASRSLLKSPLFTGLNVLGLALGLSVSILLLLHVRQELSFDRYHRQLRQIYRVILDMPNPEGPMERLAEAPNAVGPAMKAQIPAVGQTARILRHEFGKPAFIVAGDKKLVENNLLWADPELTDIFDLPVLAGDLKATLGRPSAVALSRSAALRYFGTELPLGQTLQIDQMKPVEVGAVFEDFPATSSLDADMIGSFCTIRWANNRQTWDNASFETWVLLGPGAERASVERQMAALLDQNVPKAEQNYSLWLQPLADVHLFSSQMSSSDARPGDPRQVGLLAALALAVLLIACFNYMNLATARSQLRFREVGIHKTMGASRSRLGLRFYAETGVLVSVSMILALGGLFLAVPMFNQLADSQLHYADLFLPSNLAIMAGVGLAITFSAGAYPAFVLTSFLPKNLLQTSFRRDTGAGWLRRGLVTAQFTASVALIVCTVVLYRQMQFVQQKDLGFKPRQVLAINTAAAGESARLDALVQACQSLGSVSAVCAAQTYPGGKPSRRTLFQTEDAADGLDLATNHCGPGMENVLGLHLLAGTGLSAKAADDTITHVVLSRKAVEYLGYSPEGAIGKKVVCQLGPNAVITGVIDDFHAESLHKAIGAYAFHDGDTEPMRNLLVKVNTADLPRTMQQIEAAFHATLPESPFEARFLDDVFEKLYRKDQRTARVMLIFSILSIFVSCLGLFGLAAFAAEQRTREIGIRRVLGASVGSITRLLASDFMPLIAVAVVLATPLAIWLTQRWLQDFAYRIELRGWMFALAGLLALTVGLLTVGFQGLKAALTDPVKSLKSE